MDNPAAMTYGKGVSALYSLAGSQSKKELMLKALALLTPEQWLELGRELMEEQEQAE